MIRLFVSLVCGFLVAVAVYQPANAQRIVRLGIEHYDDGSERYEVSLLKLALEHSGENAVLEVISLGDTTQDRVLLEFEQGRSDYNVFYSGGSPDREQRFEQIDIPLSRGLLGHRIFVTRKDQLDRLKHIKTLDEFRDFAVIGSGYGWPDTDIFRAAGFKVVTAEWLNIWKMLSLGRTNLFNLGLHEAHSEKENFTEIYPNLTVDNNVMVKYRFGFFFYVRKGNHALADLIRRGLDNAYASGAFMKLFENHPRIQRALRHVEDTDLTVFEIPNPFLSERHKAIPDRYWHELN
ncbi:hypothetical protein [Labrenzia sp. PHM005]|uniref:hypothetical protein n=1 Tax=Labrenzia sp. PHM005 TaxID=2590016 RepID=UPI00114087CD|nr:hypothetical protein [Labrenzia sp. PHM005]QDG77533.1 hypothetical protein FJ695_17585 [Labrenzia sp. PHM005]